MVCLYIDPSIFEIHLHHNASDILNEVGALHEYQPTISKRRRDFAPPEPSGLPQMSQINNYTPAIPDPVPSYPTNLVGQIPSSTTGNHIPSFDPTMNDWELRDLLLMGMGYLQGNSNFRDNSNYRQQDPSSNPVAYEQNRPTQFYQQQRFNEQQRNLDLSDVSSAEDMFALWSDMPAAFSR